MNLSEKLNSGMLTFRQHNAPMLFSYDFLPELAARTTPPPMVWDAGNLSETVGSLHSSLPRWQYRTKQDQVKPGIGNLAFDPLDGTVGDHGLELGQKGLFLFIDMSIGESAVHDLLVFHWSDFEVFDGVLYEFFEVSG